MSLLNANEWLSKIYVYRDFPSLKLESKLVAVNLRRSMSIKSLKRLDVPRNGRETVPQKISGAGEGFICKAARKLGFCSLAEISQEVADYFPRKNPSKQLVKKILAKYKLKSYKRRAKLFVPKKNRTYTLKWAKTLLP